MRKYQLLSITFFFLLACDQQVAYKGYGKTITQEGTANVAALINGVQTEKQAFKIKGVVDEVCQMKGCWVTLSNDQNLSIRVTFKDYGFFVPKDISGREIILEGSASAVQLSEEEARHYAEDSGKAFDSSSVKEISFVADGLLVKEVP